MEAISKPILHDRLPNMFGWNGNTKIVRTPSWLVNQELDKFPSEVWSKKSRHFINPVSKSGVYEMEMYKRLFVGLAEEIEDEEERRDWIVREMIWSMCSSYGSWEMARRTYLGYVYGADTDFGLYDGNMVEQGFLETEVNDKTGEFMVKQNDESKKWVKFDVIVGNPPYQKNVGAAGKGSRATSIYPAFVLKAIEAQPEYLTMVIPGKWKTNNGDGVGISKLLDTMLTSKKLAKIVTEPDNEEWFPGTTIRGDTMYFVWDATHNSSIVDINGELSDLTKQDIILTDRMASSIKDKALKCGTGTFEDTDFGQKPYGILSNHQDGWASSSDKTAVVCHCLGDRKPTTKMIARKFVVKNANTIDDYKVCITKASGGGGDGTSNPFIAMPGEVVSETYRVLASFDTEQKAKNAAGFVRSKIGQYLITMLKATQNISSKTLKFLPYLDFTQSYVENDLYEMFDLTKEEIGHVESTVRNFPIFRVKKEKTAAKIKRSG